MHDNAYTDFCQNCVLGLQWNMKIKSKVENLKKQRGWGRKRKDKQKKRNRNKQANKQEMIDKLKTWIKKQTHAEPERKIQDLK